MSNISQNMFRLCLLLRSVEERRVVKMSVSACSSRCLFVCLSVRTNISRTARPILAKFSMYITYGRGSVLLCMAALRLRDVMQSIGQQKRPTILVNHTERNRTDSVNIRDVSRITVVTNISANARRWLVSKSRLFFFIQLHHEDFHPNIATYTNRSTEFYKVV